MIALIGSVRWLRAGRRIGARRGRVDLDALPWETTKLLGDIADARIDRATGQAQRL